MPEILITANAVTAAQLNVCMMAAKGSTMAGPDQWCWCFQKLVGEGACGDTENYLPRATTPEVSADTFLGAMRDYQIGIKTVLAGPGGSAITPPAPAPVTTVKPGVLGATDCKFCQTVQQNPLLLILILAAGYYLLVD